MLNPQETSPRSLPVTWVAENTFLIGTSAQHTKGLLHKYYCGTNSLLGRKKNATWYFCSEGKFHL